MSEELGADIPVKPCPMCNVPGRYMTLGTYSPDGYGFTISNARVVECREHGIRPVDVAENERWRRLAYMEVAPEGPAKDTCDNCQKPQAMVGQMILYGHEPDQIRLCGGCDEEIDWRQCRPVRDRN